MSGEVSFGTHAALAMIVSEGTIISFGLTTLTRENRSDLRTN